MNQAQVFASMSTDQIAEHDARVREWKDRVDRERAAVVETKRAAAFVAMGIPPKDMARIKAGTLEPTEAVIALRTEAVLLCLSGNPGCGKTTAVGAWMWAAVDAAVSRERSAPLLVKAARLARWDRYNSAEMDRLLLAERLAIDDLGTEFQDAKGNFQALIDEVIDVRYDHRRPTVITTNLDVAQFRERYGERIADRIREAGKFVSLAGESMRGRRP